MIVPCLLLICALAGVGAALGLPGAADWVMLAGPCAVAALILLVRAGFAPRPRASIPPFKRQPIPDAIRNNIRIGPRKGGFLRPKPAHWLVIDGSNVMHWKDGTPRIETLREVLAHVTALGFSPGVVFDANAGHILAGKYQHHHAMGQLLGLPEDRIMVVDKGTPADPVILAAARDLRARIITNDRYKDWADQHPEVHVTGHLIKGGYEGGKLWLELKAPLQPDRSTGPKTARP